MESSETIRLWAKTPVKVIDIRHFSLKPGEQLQAYNLPTSAFLFINHGEARLKLDGMEATQAHFQVAHGGKNVCLNIWCLDHPVDYYLILYKPVYDRSGPSMCSQVDRLLPYAHPYVFQARYPIFLTSLLEQMHQLWTTGEELDKLQVTGLFYQFVHEQFRQLQIAGDEIAEPDLATQIAQYIRKHYRQTISMETMANLFHYSTHYLSRVFKRKFGCSPIEYVLQTRINRAKSLLTESDTPIREVAEGVGYTDMYYFNRLFKKLVGETPAQFKMHSIALKGSIRTNFMPESFIAPRSVIRHTDNNENHYHEEAWRVNEMNVRFKPSFAVTLLFSLSLLLAACGGGNENVQSSEMREYTDGLGRQVKIPVQPSKAVVLSYGGYLLPLGLKPVGVNEETLDQYPDKMADVESIGKGTGNLEAISALQPDLIILPDYYKSDIFDAYSKIAPTIAVPWGGDPDVVNTLRTMGDIMNRKQEAEAWITKFEEKLQRLRDKIDIKIEPGTTAISFIIYNGEVLLGGEGGTLGKLIYQDFGFQMPAQFKQFADGGTALSMEELVNKPADYFFTQMTDEEMKAMTELFKEPLYQSIPAIKNNRVINVSRDKWNYGPYLVDEGVDILIEEVTKLLK
ncbi:ABC transporter substrate-binding protein [Cohnella abietis]|uniref:AraC family transcriptional regulator n=1 Tax=Cohnella abietis TaxID=2507935 RepID=A0A3T1CYQ0_9BACL|nr:ABC transporter substrate-binding protein [Cohnella abietis]BBI30970.1 hypothetical protein KCTCHS21_03690 [Cohnella abietis]